MNDIKYIIIVGALIATIILISTFGYKNIKPYIDSLNLIKKQAETQNLAVQEQIQKLETQITSLNSQNNTLKSNISTLTESNNNLKQQINIGKQNIKLLQEKIKEREIIIKSNKKISTLEDAKRILKGEGYEIFDN